MDKKYLNEIEAIFDEKEAKESALRKKEQDRKEEEERRLQNFFYKRETIYKPLFEKVKKLVEDKGLKCFVENEREEDNKSAPQIKITFVRNGKISQEEASVSFSVTFDKINNQTIICENTVVSGRVVKDGSAKYDVEGVTEDFVSMKLVKLLRDAVLG